MEITNIPVFLDYCKRIRERTKRLIGIIPPELMDFTYMPGKFSIADQIRHIAAIERYMYAESLMGRPSTYQGCGKELAEGYEEIMAFLDRTHAETLTIIAGMKEEDLKKKCLTPDNVEITIWKWLRAMVEHEIHHRAELYIYLNLAGLKTPPMFGLSSEEVIERSAKGGTAS